MSGAICIECGAGAKLVGGKRIYPHRPDLFAKQFWLCGCGAYCGCHPGTEQPLGSPCGPDTRKARSAAHAAFDPMWKRGHMGRRAAYKWLAEATGIDPDRCHMGMMTADEARCVVAVCQTRQSNAA